ncbi:hypothetical protein CROQUDRAFT_133055 [Cronartium quercuum f. sp. fusiforme G11]|uniref:DNA replication regulator Sld3 C-terminal domain-containing protein n=1 Tax=Cronartium quercuum f. sp. fusiforme G11 TaxID=708437 RepID=A0A9P6NGL3_9BASI|nr:hypothetical protein CROQUDRAFT_133055 [Cronartium quercuum f. sp. fusiforme G11]
MAELDNLRQQQYSLGPTFLCPFGWPTEPNYPIDLESSIINTDGTGSTQKSEPNLTTSNLNQAWDTIFGNSDSLSDEEQVNRTYLEVLYLPESYSKSNQKSPLILLTERLKSISVDYRPEEKIELLESFLISEQVLAKKWSESVREYVDEIESIDYQEEVEIENEDEMFHAHELEVIRLIIQYHQEPLPNYKTCGSEPEPEPEREREREPERWSDPKSNSKSIMKENFTRTKSIREWIESWGAREAQIQIVFLLEIILLTNTYNDQGNQILTNHQHKILSSPKKNSQKVNKIVKNEEIVSDLENLLECLIDRLAMWQILSEFEISHHQTTNFSDLSFNKIELDDAQRFWIDVVEEFYTEQIPLLNPSFRPKLFPTSIYETTTSSLDPTSFQSTSHSLRTPNLKKLDQQQILRDSKAEIFLNSPNKRSKKNLSSTNDFNKRINSRNLFKRKEVSMTHLPFISRSNNHNRINVIKRKQILPKNCWE